MKTLREINIFRMDLSTEDAATETLVANVSFYLNKHPIVETNYDFSLGQ